MRSLSFVCVDSKLRYSMRDGLIGGVVLMLVSAVLVLFSRAALHIGLAATAEFLRIASLPAALALSMPFWVLKGQSRRVQVAVVAATISVAVLVTLV